TYGDPHFPDIINQAPYPHFITTRTPITLTPVDGGQICAIGVEKTWWYDEVVDDKYCESEEACAQWNDCPSPYDCNCNDNGGQNGYECVEAQQQYCTENWEEEEFDSWEECVEYYVNYKCVSCVCENNWQLLRYDGQGNPEPIFKDEESCHIIQFFSVDALGNIEQMHRQCVYVDDTPPVGEKVVGQPNIKIEASDVCGNGKGWSEPGPPQTNCNIIDCCNWYQTAHIHDLGQVLPSGNVYMEYTPGYSEGCSDVAKFYYSSDGNSWTEFYSESVTSIWQSGWKKYNTTQLVPAAFRYIKIEIQNCFNDYSSASYETDFWVGKNTQISLDCTDQLPHPVGNEQVCYKVSFDGTPADLTDKYCEEFGGQMKDGWCCEDVSDNLSPTDFKLAVVIPPKKYTFNFLEDSLHDLEYYCVDALGNKNQIDKEWFRVDTLPPVITKTMIGDDHLGQCPPINQGDVCYVRDDGQNGVHVSARDDTTYPDCAVGLGICQYMVWWNTTEQECHTKYPNAEYTNGWCLTNTTLFENEADVIFKEDSKHLLTVTCWDLLGNSKIDQEYFQVDSTPPVTTKTYGTPTKVVGDYRWITSDTEITLTATDAKVGVDKIFWRVTQLNIPDNQCKEQCVDVSGSGDFKEYVVYEQQGSTKFKIPEDSCHLIEFYSVDKLGNIESLKHQCVFVDNTPPQGIKAVGEPKLPCTMENGGEGNGEIEGGDTSPMEEVSLLQIQPECWWVRDHVTPITLDCEDQNPHPVGQETVCFKISFDGNPSDLTSQYCTEDDGRYMNEGYCCKYVGEQANLELKFKEDSLHDLEFYCVDHLGNKGATDLEWFKVDSTPPVTTKTYIPPFYKDQNGWDYIDTASKVKLEATDGGTICAVGKVETYYRYRQVDDSLCKNAGLCVPDNNIDQKFEKYTEPFGIAEESCHIIEYYSEDALGNTEELKAQCVFVDKTPPVITKRYGKPYYSKKTQQGLVEWINSLTPITITASDYPESHPSGLKTLEYRITLVDDDKCWSWAVCQGATGTGDFKPVPESPVYISEESCHLIEIRAEDNVGKKSEHKQCVFVDNTPPVPNKTVEEPKTRWDGKDANFYEIAQICKLTDEPNSCLAGENCIDCWKVTLDTKINLGCVDPEPHPVDHNKVCFKVDVDGTDFTKKYCWSWIYGYQYYNETSGYCCLPYEEKEFRFLEETEHNLKYYCVDALGNAGPVDEEKFKVGGKKFEIPLCKKWNLISVPFVLLNDDPEAVFKNTPGVESVWAYDSENEQWLVWTPGEAPDTLTSIEPGWGYWVLEKDGCEELVLGGSLFDTLAVPPTRNIVKGWNLIGYYGTTPKEEAYCALNSLIDTQEGYPRWSSLWTYSNKNCRLCDGKGCGGIWGWYGWSGLDVCDKMTPGRGYWIEIDVPDKYAPASVCIWNKDFPELECVEDEGWLV
ncbi:MAG: discoidin domain-containing protein, partial [Candidatus Anstonellales archaeon]